MTRTASTMKKKFFLATKSESFHRQPVTELRIPLEKVGMDSNWENPNVLRKRVIQLPASLPTPSTTVISF